MRIADQESLARERLTDFAAYDYETAGDVTVEASNDHSMAALRAATRPMQPRRMTGGWPALYPDTYAWFVLLATLDIVLTWIVLFFGGEELNAVARWILARYELVGMVVFKFSIVTLVICSCEYIGRKQRSTGRRLAEWAVAISAVPVVLAYAELLVVVHT